MAKLIKICSYIALFAFASAMPLQEEAKPQSLAATTPAGPQPIPVETFGCAVGNSGVCSGEFSVSCGLICVRSRAACAAYSLQSVAQSFQGFTSAIAAPLSAMPDKPTTTDSFALAMSTINSSLQQVGLGFRQALTFKPCDGPK
jgi:hypothetical protein